MRAKVLHATNHLTLSPVDEAKQRQVKELELEQLRQQLAKLTQDKERMRVCHASVTGTYRLRSRDITVQIIVEKNMVFHKFLEDAILMTDDESFTEIGDPTLLLLLLFLLLHLATPLILFISPSNLPSLFFLHLFAGDLLLRHETLAHHHDDLMQRR